MKDDDFKLLRGFDYERMDRRTDICDCLDSTCLDLAFSKPNMIYKTDKLKFI